MELIYQDTVAQLISVGIALTTIISATAEKGLCANYRSRGMRFLTRYEKPLKSWC